MGRNAGEGLIPAAFHPLSWPGLTRPSTSCHRVKEDVDARPEAGHDAVDSVIAAPLTRNARPYRNLDFDRNQRRLPWRDNRNIIHDMKYPLPAIVRLRVLPDPPADGPPPSSARGRAARGVRTPTRRSRRCAGSIEQTVLTYGEIAAKTGVGRASICRWTRDGQWQRPLFAPRATDTVPSARAGARLKLRTLFARLAALAERYIRELEASRQRRSRQARRGAGASQDGEARRPPAAAQAARGNRRRRAALGRGSRARWSGACAPPASTPSARPRTR